MEGVGGEDPGRRAQSWASAHAARPNVLLFSVPYLVAKGQRMKVILSLGILATLGSFAQAQERPVPDLNKSPWSATTNERSDGLSGTSTTTIKRDIGDGFSVGGQMKTPYRTRRSAAAARRPIRSTARAAATPSSARCWRRSFSGVLLRRLCASQRLRALGLALSAIAAAQRSLLFFAAVRSGVKSRMKNSS